MSVDNVFDKKGPLELLGVLNSDNPVDYPQDLNDLCKRNIAAIENCQFYCKLEDCSDNDEYNSDDTSSIYQYIRLNITCLSKLGNVFDNSDLLNPLSVQENKNLKNIFRNIIGIGISSNILPNLPYHTKLPSEDHILGDTCVFTRYKRLAATTFGIYTLTKSPSLKQIIIPYYMNRILASLYQLIYCPIKKPSDAPDKNGFIMTHEIYNTLINNRVKFMLMLEDMGSSVHRNIYIRETMMLIGNQHSSCTWLKRAVSSTLTTIIRKPKGVEHIAWSMLDAAGLDVCDDDKTKSWKILEVIGKIIIASKKIPDFQKNICKQVNDLLDLRNSAGTCVEPFERLFTLCTTLLFHEDELLCQEVFIKHLLNPLTWFTNDVHNFSDDEDVLEIISQRVRILRALLSEQSFSIPVVPTGALNSIAKVLFRLYTVILTTDGLKTLNDDIKVVVLRFLRELDTDEMFTVFDVFLFDFDIVNYLKFRKDVDFVVQQNSLIIKNNQFSVGLQISYKADALICLMEEDNRATTLLFAYLINCLCYAEKYFDQTSVNTELLYFEGGAVLSDACNRKMVVYKLLSSLSENTNVQEYINSNPSVLIPYIKAVLLKSIETKVHQTKNYESDAFQSLFLIVMLFQVLIDNTTVNTILQYEVLIQPLQIIINECDNTELQTLIEAMLLKLKAQSDKSPKSKNKPDTITELAKAIEDVCGPLLPVRGHGLMALTKLIENKDQLALERKNYILNIFQQNLKNEDSFIYLNSIKGLAAMADVFPDIVIKVLADEYSEFSRSDDSDGHEVRIKIGEVLVRVVKRLGEMAPIYKALLLNTFLLGTKDEDHLIRTSSLSNLGEICRVLGYKLGSIVSEVLVCVHAVMTTDKMLEPRRAAVTVIRQLFLGLEKEMIVFLKNEILPLYRTLKNIYNNDVDDVMRLQAQLALEQLNENMKDFVFPNPQLFFDKHIVSLDSK